MAQVDSLPPLKGEQVREWLKYPDRPAKDDRPPIRWVTKSAGYYELAGLTGREADAVQAFLRGTSYIRCVNGRLHAYDALEPLPSPSQDPVIGPHWRTDGQPKMWGGLPPGEGWHAPGIVLTGLGAGLYQGRYNDLKKDLAENQRKVEECGFTCLRSRRGDDGGYWEQWVLHSLHRASGPLQRRLLAWRAEQTDLRAARWHAEAEEACRFLTRDINVSYGSLDITIQRWALADE